MRLEPAPGPQETAFVAARRVGGRFEYVLRRMLPYGPTRCEAQTPQGERFCKRLEQYLQAESFVPQEPALGENTPQESALSGADNTAAQEEPAGDVPAL